MKESVRGACCKISLGPQIVFVCLCLPCTSWLPGRVKPDVCDVLGAGQRGLGTQVCRL